MGTEYGYPRYLLNKNIKYNFKITNIYNHKILIYGNFRIKILSNMLRPFINKLSVFGYFPLNYNDRTK